MENSSKKEGIIEGGDGIKTKVKVNGEEMEVEVGGKYDSEGKILLDLESFYPNN